jgi:hypothetical protein
VNGKVPEKRKKTTARAKRYGTLADLKAGVVAECLKEVDTISGRCMRGGNEALL